MTLFRTISTCSLIFLIIITACSDASEDGPENPPEEVNVSEQNLLRAMELTDAAVTSHFTGDGMAMARYYNPYTGVRSDEKGSIWMYTSAIEAVTLTSERGCPASSVTMPVIVPIPLLLGSSSLSQELTNAMRVPSNTTYEKSRRVLIIGLKMVIGLNMAWFATPGLPFPRRVR